MKEIIASILSFIITIVVFVLQNTISLVIYCNHEYPQFTSIVFTIVGLYLCYKFLVRILRMWLNFWINALKVAVFCSIVFLLALVYVRGFDRLVHQDWPFVKKIFDTFYSGEKASWSDTFTSGQRILAEGASFLDDIGVEDPYAYFDYVKDNFDDNKDSFDFEDVFHGVKDFFANSHFEVNW